MLFCKVVRTHTSTRGWRGGAICEGMTVREEWSLSQSRLHINYLEPLTVRLALKHSLLALLGHHVLMRTDNSTATRSGGGYIHCAQCTYISRTQEFRSCDQLFVRYVNGASWQGTAALPLDCGGHLPGLQQQGACLCLSVCAYSTRGRAASWALFRGVSVEEVCVIDHGCPPIPF